MKAAILEQRPGGLHIEEIPMPEPLAGEVLVKVTACGVCHTDLHVMKAEVAFPTPAVMGHEISGTVVGARPRRRGSAVGTPVASAFIMPCGFCRRVRRRTRRPVRQLLRDEPPEGARSTTARRGCAATTARRSRCTRWRAWRSMRSCRRPTSSRCPTACRSHESAVLGCAVFTAYGAVRHGADLRGGERIAVVAAGGVGINIIQIAEAFGASQIIAVDVRDDKLEVARRVWAPPTSSTRRATDATARVRELTDGRGVDVAFEVLGLPQTFTQAFEIIRDGGRMVAVGIAPGKTTAPVEITRLVRRGLRIIGSYGARTRSGHAGDHPARGAGHLPPRDHRHPAILAGRGRRRATRRWPRRDRRPRDRGTVKGSDH